MVLADEAVAVPPGVLAANRAWLDDCLRARARVPFDAARHVPGAAAPDDADSEDEFDFD